MPLYLNDEQAMFQETAQSFLAEHAPVSHARTLRDSHDEQGFCTALWQRFAEMGFASILVPETFSGLGLGHVEAGIIATEIGSNLTPSPYLSTAVGAVVALRGSEGHGEWLAAIGRGEISVALGIDGNAKHSPYDDSLIATADDSGFRLDGQRRTLPYGHVADLLITSARPSSSADGADEMLLLALRPDTPGIHVTTRRLVDSSLVADVRFDNVVVPANAALAAPAESRALLDEVLSALRTGAAAELVGLATGAMHRTIAYLHDRKQFGVQIGSFQALQHRAAILYAEIELAHAAVLKAQHALDDASPERHADAMVAKAAATLAATLSVQESLQMHGGIGMTDEHDIGLFMKRARVLAELYGDANFHADALATTNGY